MAHLVGDADWHDILEFPARELVLAYRPYNCNFDCSIMFATSRIQRRYDHRLKVLDRVALILAKPGLNRKVMQGAFALALSVFE